MNGPRPIRTAHRLPNARSSLVRAALPAPSTPRTPRAPGCALRTPPAVALSAVRSLHACVAPSPLQTPQSRGHEGWPFRDLRRPLVDRGARSAVLLARSAAGLAGFCLIPSHRLQRLQDPVRGVPVWPNTSTPSRASPRTPAQVPVPFNATQCKLNATPHLIAHKHKGSKQHLSTNCTSLSEFLSPPARLCSHPGRSRSHPLGAVAPCAHSVPIQD